MIYNWIFGRDFCLYDPLANLEEEIKKCIGNK